MSDFLKSTERSSSLQTTIHSVTGSLKQCRRWTRTVHRKTNSRCRIRSGWVFYDYTWCSNYSYGIISLLSYRQVFLDLKNYILSFFAKFWRAFLSIVWLLLIYTYSYGWCRTLLTSITSKMVRLHLLYALLILFLILGSMGTGEDLFYKVLRTLRRKCPLIIIFLQVSWNPWN